LPSGRPAASIEVTVFPTRGGLGSLSPEEKAEFFLRHDTFWLD
jgi:hypothetical protein